MLIKGERALSGSTEGFKASVISIERQAGELIRRSELWGLKLPKTLREDMGLAAAWALEAFPDQEIKVNIHPWWMECADIERSILGKAYKLHSLIPERKRKDFDQMLERPWDDSLVKLEGLMTRFLRYEHRSLVLEPSLTINPQGQVEEVSFYLDLEGHGFIREDALSFLAITSGGVSFQRWWEGRVQDSQSYGPGDRNHQAILNLMRQTQRILKVLWPSRSQPRLNASWGDLIIRAFEGDSGLTSGVDVRVERQLGLIFSRHTFNFHTERKGWEREARILDQRGFRRKISFS